MYNDHILLTYYMKSPADYVLELSPQRPLDTDLDFQNCLISNIQNSRQKLISRRFRGFVVHWWAMKMKKKKNIVK